MLSVKELLPYYPEPLRVYREFILREYLQHKILQIVFDQPAYAGKLCFMGGTCLRIVHGNQRFSEDLDFDNTGLAERDFERIARTIEAGLEREGYTIEMNTVYRGAFHCYVRFPGLLYQEGLTGHREQKILIQLDAEPQHFSFQPAMHIINRFDIFTEIPSAPLNLLLAQKFYAILNRARAKGRDFFDTMFLLSKGIIPDYAYLHDKIGISEGDTLRERVLSTCAALDMRMMANEVEPFLFKAADNKKVLLFPRYLETVPL